MYVLLGGQTRAGFWNQYPDQVMMVETHFAQNGEAE